MAVCLIILPGPDTAIATRNTLSLGKNGGFKTMLGTCCALLIHTIAAVVGLSAIIVKSALLFSIFKYAGAIYLVYIGIKSLWSMKERKIETGYAEDSAEQSAHHHRPSSCFRQGFLTNLLNPKVALFFLTFLPQFLERGSDAFVQFSIMGLTYTVLTAVWFFFYVYLINQISVLMKRPATQRIMQGVTGVVLIGFGMKLALEKQN
ncbi:LysE family translocator [Fictibacillus terranigra]|uniref:LysE family translocator n=1 Tax=Fictibacillus terranigra TaxID=3058424 RepID=A0ABT8E230_9BACL|nr:LysE family translocator [Fictibacillus sp. CENA-BCM004]MDN4071975.1 LysE family translocator [Fictibacillus sp. CENA-BCM004]